MSRFFMYGASLEGIEQLMMAAPNFSPRRSSIAIDNYWNEQTDELNSKVVLYNEHFEKYHGQIEDALSDAFEINTRNIFNDLVGNITLNPVCPRFFKERRFDVFYKNSERGALGMSIHEIIHYIWFFVWNSHFNDSYDEYETPSLKWMLSEMVVESIMSDNRLSSINSYFSRDNGGCVYGYFQDMVIENEPILGTLQQMYKEKHMTDFMEESYNYCIAHEKAIRAHIAESEKAF